jgi:glycine/D-amino acid oxidase-like deaminating enzyme
MVTNYDASARARATGRSARHTDRAVVESPGVVWWLAEALAGEPELSLPPLTGPVRADVCVIGGGYTGLWTAIEIREQSPGTTVVLIEREQCGFGASGRNGGWATGWHDELDGLIAKFGEREALRLAARSSWAIDRIESFSQEHNIDCHFRRRGALWTASSPWQVGSWESAMATCERLGRTHRLEAVDPKDLRQRTGSALLLAGVRQTDAAAVQPALLVRGMRRVAHELGVRIYESTPMINLDRRRPAVVHTPAGTVTAERVVLSTGAWAAELRELRRAVIPIGSQIVATEPMGERLKDLKWASGELLGDSQLMVHYAQVSSDGRIVFGRGGGALGPLGRVRDRHFYDPVTLGEVAADFRRWFPQFADVRLTHGWGGPVDRAPGHLPFVGRLDADSDVLYGIGYSGNGVAPSALIGRILGRLAVGMSDDDTEGALAQGPPGYLPPEPIRSLGGAGVRAAVRFAEREEGRAVQSRSVHRVLRRLVATTVPHVLDPRRGHRGGQRDDHSRPR